MKERGARKGPKIRVWHVLQRESTPELPELVRLCASWGVDGLLCSASLTNFGSESLVEVAQGRRAVAEELQQVLPEARALAEGAGLPFSCPSGPPAMSTPERGEPCRWPWGKVFISARGEVRPCPFAAGPEGLTVGRLFAEDGRRLPFAESWNGEAMQELRRQLVGRRNPAFCRACYPGWNGRA